MLVKLYRLYGNGRVERLTNDRSLSSSFPPNSKVGFIPIVRLLFINRTGTAFPFNYNKRTKAETDSIVSKLSGLRYLHMCWLAKPAADRVVYKTIKKRRIKSIVEIGLGDGTRCEKMIRAAQTFSEGEIRYTGIDLFESREGDQERFSLLEMHKRLKKTGAKVKLIPGNAESSTARVANSLAGTDLFLLTLDEDLDSLNRFWFFFPRMAHDDSLLLVQSGPDVDERFRILTKKDWEKWTGSAKNSGKKAA